MISRPTMVMLRESDDPDVAVLRPEDFGDRTLDSMTVGRDGTMGEFIRLLQSPSFECARCALIDEVGSLTPYIDRYGSDLAMAWTYAFSPYHQHLHRTGRNTPIVNGWVVNLDDGQCMRVTSTESDCLPYLLYIGPDAVCADPRKGMWAFKRLCWRNTAPASEDRLVEISGHL